MPEPLAYAGPACTTETHYKARPWCAFSIASVLFGALGASLCPILIQAYDSMGILIAVPIVWIPSFIGFAFSVVGLARRNRRGKWRQRMTRVGIQFTWKRLRNSWGMCAAVRTHGVRHWKTAPTVIQCSIKIIVSFHD